MNPKLAMVSISLAAALSTCVGAGAQEAHMNLQAVPFSQVKVKDRFWLPKMEVNRTTTVPYSLDMLEKTSSIHNLELAAAGSHEGFVGPPWTDSDVYKALESASYTLAAKHDAALDGRIDGIIAKIAAAQSPDGYLNSFYEVTAPSKRFTNLSLNHELYCAGHLFEAAVAHFQATGKRNLLDVATRYADYIDSVFGDGPGKRLGYCGHPEIELALVKLWRVTGEKRYFELARYFIERRGSGFLATEKERPEWHLGPEYFQDDVPIREHTTIKGHAVRAAYLFSGVTDIVRENGDPELSKMLDRVWRNTAYQRMYITGGIGPSASNEGFTNDYDLPNATAYQETCASIALAMWNQRMGLLHGDAKYIDLVETSLYNASLAGISLDGKRFFYDNVLSSVGGKERSEWFGCACCPPNISRTLASIGGYAYALSKDTVWVNLYIQSDADLSVAGQKVRLAVKTDYPWDGRIRVTLTPASPAKFGLKLRVPGWCSGASVKINGESADPATTLGYIAIDRMWHPGDVVELNLPMEVEQIEAHPAVKDDAGRLAIRRGPIIYCLEGVDQPVDLDRIGLPRGTKLKPQKRPNLLGGVVVLRGTGEASPDQDWTGVLYAPSASYERVPVTAIPYALWCNRGPSAMEVWVPTVPPPAPANGVKITASFQSGLSDLPSVYDGSVPEKSNVRTTKLFHWWPNKSGVEWVQYEWKKPVTVEGSKVYWFDDTGIGECRIPSSWRILYKDGDAWKPVESPSDYATPLDSWCEVRFTPVKTTALRLEVKLKDGFSGGIHEWAPML